MNAYVTIMKFIEKFILISAGALLIAFITTYFSLQYSLSKERDYRSQLKRTIDEKYLEGKDIIGALSYNGIKNTFKLEKVSDFDISNNASWLMIHRNTSWNLFGINDYTNFISKMMLSKQYKYYNFWECPIIHAPFLVIVKKTSDGYDIIGEYIIGLGVSSDLNILKTQQRYNAAILSLFPNQKTSTYYSYCTNTNIESQYVQHLLNTKYRDVCIYDGKLNNADKKNGKYEMLNELVVQAVNPMYFSVNKYYELKLQHDIYGNSLPVESRIDEFSYSSQTLFTETVTMHYRIEGNQDVVEKEEKENLACALIFSESIYLILLLIAYKKNRKRR